MIAARGDFARAMMLTPAVLVEDIGPMHTSQLSLAAINGHAYWLTGQCLPDCARKRNDIETVWRNLIPHHLARQNFADPNALDHAIHWAAAQQKRTTLSLAGLRISVHAGR